MVSWYLYANIAKVFHYPNKLAQYSRANARKIEAGTALKPRDVSAVPVSFSYSLGYPPR